MENRETRLISGKGQYADDLDFPGMAHLVFVGSPHAHAVIKRLEVDKALKVPGVLTVITGQEMVKYTNPLPVQANFKSKGWTWRLAHVYAMPKDKVRWYGEPVAAVVAEDEKTARKAADLVEVEYEPLAVTGNALEALEPDAPKLYDDWEDNKQVHLKFDFGEPETAFEEADQVMHIKTREGRVTGLPIEGRGCVANYNLKKDTLEMWGSFQTPYLARHNIAATLGMPEVKVKINAVDIGGAFGLKIHAWKENVVALASKLTGRHVKWFEPQKDFIVTGPHQRDVFWEGDVAFKNDGTLLGVKATVTHDLGVESTNKGIAALSIFPACSAVPNMYRWKGMHIEGVGAATNKSFYCAYRGYGKDKGIKFIEHALNQIARKLGMTPEAIRLKNYIQPDEFPYHQINSYVYDSGDYPGTLKKALDMANVDEVRAKKEQYLKEGKYIGVGVISAIEPAGVAVPNCQMGGITQARVQITADGTIEVHSDRTEIGQGSEASHAIIVSNILGCNREDVLVKPVTSDYIGQGPLSSRGAVYPASAVAKAAKILKKKVSQCAAAFLKVDEASLVMEGGLIFSSNNPDEKLTYKELAEKSYFFPGPRGLPPEILKNHDHLLDVTTTWYSPTTPDSGSSYTSFCTSADVAVVEVDIDTGATKIIKYAHVHDAGTIIDKQIVDGQIHGGIVQGIGEALSERLDYNEKGQLMTSSFSTYLIPTAVEAPDIEVAHLETPSPFTETGSKGMGEAPIIGSKAVILAAIEDALTPFNIEVNESPATPERVRSWIVAARKEQEESK
ncbi:carbon-monoxide dehydrogenase large subunit [Desulfocicer vacuolatum DSM 3385]|uniref:Carbon-monoxide dehydrogenase large subunit n=1 Tax=Desulfocicer vacuolatum DSM 3385 TaxID=1121400 RepID=A0A1W2AWV4_9BACT|nr:xanthine dehydrogenase family protein molybdopterin-binding subunit [Desulfocicer vacuolatum]SMC65195.1 carbon-monoxide dehydrogenase large subunit [Desulfocicer vacuolatum DSM 3385]